MSLKLQLRSYDLAFTRFVSNVVSGFLGLDPLIGPMYHESVVHAGPIRNVRGSDPLDQELMPVTSEGKLHRDEIKNTDIDASSTFLFEIAQGVLASFGPQFFRGLAEVTEKTGMTLDAKGSRFSVSMLNTMLEEMLIDFDSEGNPILPTLIIHPNMLQALRKIKPNAEEEAKFHEIIDRKRAEFLSEKRNRKIS